MSQRTAARLLIFARAFALAGSMLYALIYSRALGVERRSVVTAILVFSYIFCVLLTSGLNLAFRRTSIGQIAKNKLDEFATLSLTLAFLCSFLTFIALQIFSIHKENIPDNLLYITILYSFFASLDNSGFEGSITNKKIRATSTILIITILIQIFTYYVLTKLNFFSIAVNVLSAYLCSYITSFVLYVLINKPKISLKNFSYLPQEMVKDSLYALILNLIDKVDRLIIVIMLPLASISRMTMALTLLSLFRFVPDMQTRLLMLDLHIGINHELLTKYLKLFLPIVIILILPLSHFYNFAISILLGNQWRLNEILLMFLSLQEILRGYFQYTSVRFVKNSSAQLKNITALYFFAMFIILVSTGTAILGVWGVPLGMITAYIIATFRVKKYVNK